MISRFLLFIRTVAPFVYIAAGFVILFRLRSFMSARYDLALAQFQLERERAEERGGRSITQIIVLLEIAALVFLLANVSYDAWNDFIGTESVQAATSTPRFGTDIPGDVGEGFIVSTVPAEGPQLVQTAQPTVTPAGTLLPADAPVGCSVDNQAYLTVPNNGQIIFEVESIEGTANIQNFGYYRFEIRSMDDEDESFRVIGGAASDNTTPVVNGPLGTIIPQNYVPGEYRFRMTVFDHSGTLREVCEITIFISEPLPTSTPIGGGLPPVTGEQ